MKRKNKRAPKYTGRVIGYLKCNPFYSSEAKLVFRKGQEDRMVQEYMECIEMMGIFSIKYKVRHSEVALQKRLGTVNTEIFGGEI